MIPYCEPFEAWLKTERKDRPPCDTCADASSRRRRAREMRLQAEVYERAADEIIKKEHP